MPGSRKYSTENKIFLWILANEGTAPGVNTCSPSWVMRRESVSASLSSNSWQGMCTLYRKVLGCRREWQTPLTLPWTEEDTVTFTSYLASSGMAPTSIRTMANKISTLHEVLGHHYSRPAILTRSLTGIANSGILKKQSSRKKLAMTPPQLLEIRGNMVKQAWPVQFKRMTWMALTMMASGCLRVGEILPPKPTSFVAEQTPLLRDLRLLSKVVDGVSYKYLLLTIRCSKANNLSLIHI